MHVSTRGNSGPPGFKDYQFPDNSVGKESVCNAGDLGLIPGLGRYPGQGKGYPCQYFGLDNSMDCIVHGVAKSWSPADTLPSGVSSPSVRRVIAPLHSVVSWTTEEKAKQAPTTVSGTQIRIRFVKKVRSFTYALIPTFCTMR